MSSNDRIGECVYCGRTRRLTSDHVPPRCLFGSVPADNLITVPACLECNNRASKDDEYFRLKVALRDDVGDHTDVQALLPKVLRSLQRPDARGFRSAFLSDIRQAEALTPAGLVVGRRTAYDVDLIRLCRVPTRIVRGLFWHQRKYRLSGSHSVETFALAGFRGNPSALDALRVNVIGPLLLTRPVEVGTVFSCWSAFLPDGDGNMSAWLLRFYQRVVFVSLVLDTSQV
jgi:hypothetical protein